MTKAEELKYELMGVVADIEHSGIEGFDEICFDTIKRVAGELASMEQRNDRWIRVGRFESHKDGKGYSSSCTGYARWLQIIKEAGLTGTEFEVILKPLPRPPQVE